MFHDKTMFDISFSYINHHFDHMGPGFEGFFQQKMVFRFRWYHFDGFWSSEMMFHDETLFSISFSYIKQVFDDMGPGFDRLDRQKIVFRFYWSNFHEFISREVMIGAKTLFMISFSYIKPHFDHMGPGFDGFFQQKMVFRFYWSNFHEFISMEMMSRDQTMFKISFS